MFKKALFTTAAVLGLCLGTAPADAHNALDLKEGYAGYSTPMILSVNHGCHGSPVVGFRIKVPQDVHDAKAAFDPAWDIEYKMRKLEDPIMAHGRPVSEVVDEIIWKNPVKVVPANGWYPFKFRMTLPDEPGKVFHVQNIQRNVSPCAITHAFHGGLVLPPPGIGKRMGIHINVKRIEKSCNIASNTGTPVHDRAEDVEQQPRDRPAPHRTVISCCRVAALLDMAQSRLTCSVLIIQTHHIRRTERWRKQKHLTESGPIGILTGC
ncbi:MAG: DUF1775 domain-containing protein [Rhodospirillaceae bacterium]|nr:DUF1775 domain-containing protein [Rhodospirillaceae bacterium]